MQLHELMQITELHVFHDHAEWFLLSTHTQNTDNVGVLQLSHNLHLLLEVNSATEEKLNTVKPLIQPTTKLLSNYCCT